MAEKTKVEFETKLLTQLLKNLKKAGYVEVGIIDASKNDRKKEEGEEGNYTNAEIGAVHEFGVNLGDKTAIPQRSFLRMPIEDDLDEALLHKHTQQELVDLIVEDPAEFFDKIGNVAVGVIMEAFDQGGSKKTKWASLNPEYEKTKTNKQILVETQQLRGAISYNVVGEWGDA